LELLEIHFRMDSLSGKRRTQIDFRKLKSSPRPQNSVLLGSIKELESEEKPDRTNDSRLKESLANISLRKTTRHQEEIGVAHTTSSREVRLPEVIPSGVNSHEHVKLRSSFLLLAT
jgi:hypothetical protein